MRANKGKFVVLGLYIVLVFLSPLYLLTPFAQDQLRQLTNSIVSNEADQFFREHISALRDNDIDRAYSMLSPEAQAVTATTSLQELTTYFASTTDSIEFVGGKFNSVTTSDGKVTEYEVHYQIPNNDPVDKFVVVYINAEDVGGGLKVHTVQANKIAQSVQEQGDFSLESQWFPLLLSLLIPLFIVYTAYRYLTKATNPKWILFLIILLLSLSITITGEKIGANFGLVGFMNKSGMWGPWIFSLPIPLGAIYYYFVFKKKEGFVPEEKV